jgi:hypothetical protein
MKNGIKHGGLRRLTLGEINLARTLYSFSIRYNEVWIHRESYLPFNMQRQDTAMTPTANYGSRKEHIKKTFQCHIAK